MRPWFAFFLASIFASGLAACSSCRGTPVPSNQSNSNAEADPPVLPSTFHPESYSPPREELIVQGASLRVPGALFDASATTDLDQDGDDDLVASVVFPNGETRVLLFQRAGQEYEAPRALHSWVQRDRCNDAPTTHRLEQPKKGFLLLRAATLCPPASAAFVPARDTQQDFVLIALDGTNVQRAFPFSWTRDRLFVDRMVHFDQPALPPTAGSQETPNALVDFRFEIEAEGEETALRLSDASFADLPLLFHLRASGLAFDQENLARNLDDSLSKLRREIGEARANREAIYARVLRFEEMLRGFCTESGEARLVVGEQTGVVCDTRFASHLNRTRALLAQMEIAASKGALALRWIVGLASNQLRDRDKQSLDRALARIAETGWSALAGPTLNSPQNVTAPHRLRFSQSDWEVLVFPNQSVDLRDGSTQPVLNAVIESQVPFRLRSFGAACGDLWVEVAATEGSASDQRGRGSRVVRPATPDACSSSLRDPTGWLPLGFSSSSLLILSPFRLRSLPLDQGGVLLGESFDLQNESLPMPLYFDGVSQDGKVVAWATAFGIVLFEAESRTLRLVKPSSYTSFENTQSWPVAISPSGKRIAWLQNQQLMWVSHSSAPAFPASAIPSIEAQPSHGEPE